MGRLFGTDGVRGVANADLTAELALGLSVAAAHVLAEAGTFAGHRPVAVVGRDPRASGEFLEAAVVAGLASAGVDVLRVGVLPTPAVAYLTGALGADLGVMLSASHNAMPDNGVKFLARGGHKLDDELEDADRDDLRGAPHRRPLEPSDRRRRRPGPRLRRGLRPVRRPPRRGAAEPARRPEGRPRRGARRGLPGLARGVLPGRRRGGHHRRPARRPEHQRRLRLHPPRPAQGRRGRARRRLRHRARRRRRPLPGRGRRRRRGRRRPDPRHPRAVAARARRAAREHRGRHRDVQPGLQAGDGARGHPARPDRGRRPLRAGVDEGARLRARRRAVRPRHRAGPRHHRRRHADRPAAGRPGRRDQAARWPTSPPSWTGCRRC